MYLTWFSKNYFKIAILFILGFFAFKYYQYTSTLKFYAINSSCAEKAILYAKEQDNEFQRWEVTQSIFNKDRNACLAEFNYRFPVSGSHGIEIYDITHNKTVTSLDSTFVTINPELYTQQAKSYENIKSNIFQK